MTGGLLNCIKYIDTRKAEDKDRIEAGAVGLYLIAKPLLVAMLIDFSRETRSSHSVI